MGEEDQFYIREHHEPIINEEVFEKAQEILNRRNKNRGKTGDGKRENFEVLKKIGYNLYNSF